MLKIRIKNEFDLEESFPNNVFWGMVIFIRFSVSITAYHRISRLIFLRFQIGKSYNQTSQDLRLLIAVSSRDARVPLAGVSINGVPMLRAAEVENENFIVRQALLRFRVL